MFGDIVQVALFVIMAAAILIIILAVLKNVPRGKKGSYRTSKSDK
jgi:hypothetical protein